MNVVIWDIDNCLSDDGWRIPFIEWAAPTPSERYRKYHALCYGDKPHHQRYFAESIANGEVPLFITGRPEAERYSTTRWLERHLPPMRELVLLMRGDGDERSSVDVKMALLTAQLQAWGPKLPRIVCAHDDRQEILDMYRYVFGVPDVRRFAIHEQDSYRSEVAL